jgi:vacuolar-type H+-ATPase subunit E/Vma4
MGLDDLLAALAREARLEARAILKQAHAEREEILKASEARIGALQHRRLKRQKSAFAEEARGRIAKVQRETRAALLAAQDKLVERVLSRVEERLGQAAVIKRLKSTLPVRLPLLLHYGEGRELVVRCSPGLAPALRGMQGLPSDLRVRQDAEIVGGVQVESAEADLLIDDTLGARLRRRRRVLRMQILNAVVEAEE